jgi:hypothetical protein
MTKTIRSYALFGAMVVMMAALLAGAGSMRAQDANNLQAGVPHDWSHRHVVFSNPGTAEEAITKGTYGEWLKITSEPRFQLQRMKREAAAKANLNPEQLLGPVKEAEVEEARDGAEDAAGMTEDGSVQGEIWQRFRRRPTPRLLHNNLKTDWSVNLGAGATVGQGMFPAKFSFNPTIASCATDFVVFNTSLAGAAGQASIIAFNNLYSGCGGGVPTTFWAYNTNGGTILTSVVLSFDGSQVAFAQNQGAGTRLVVLKWKAGALTTLVPVAAAAYRTCTAPCMTSIAFGGAAATDTKSSVYYDYANDIAYVGDDGGKLQKFTGVFNGTPALAGAPWPKVLSGQGLSSPVFDPISGNVFVGDYNTTGTCSGGTPCGFLFSVVASTGVSVKSGQLDFDDGIVDAPLLDAVAARVYAFVGRSVAGGLPNHPSQVRQLSTSFGAGTTGVGVDMPGAAGANGRLFVLSGTFDNAYFTSATPASPTGHLYMIAGTGNSDNTLFQVPIAANVMGAPVTGPALSNNNSVHGGTNVAAQNVSEIFTGSKDYIFTSTKTWGLPIAGCAASAANGCVQGFDVTSGTISAATTPTGASPVAGGASAIIIDDIGTSLAGTGNIYYSTLGNDASCGGGGCAIQITQTAP